MIVVTAGSTDVSVYFQVVQDVGGANPGEPATPITNTDVASVYYIRDQAAPVSIGSISLLAGADSSHTDGAFIEVSAGNAPGLCRIDVPDLAFASGSRQVTIWPKMVDGLVAEPIQIGILELDVHGEGAQASTRAAKGVVLVSVNDASGTATSWVGQDDGAGTLSSSDDAYNGQVWLFTSGALKGQRGEVTDYTGSTKTFTFASGDFTAAPADNDEGVLLP